MKVKLLSILLGASVLFNIAGLVFFISYLRLQGTYRTVKRENAAMINTLNASRASDIAAQAGGGSGVSERHFASLLDGQEDVYVLAPPATPGRMDNTLVVYLHGMGSTAMEPFACPSGTTIAQGIASAYPDLCILSCNYRQKASWGSDAAMADITQNIRAVMQEYPIKQVVIMGTSMGGCTALTYAAAAPADIKEKLTGVVSVEGAGDLYKLARTSKEPTVAAAIAAAMGGTYEQAKDTYTRKSFLPNIDKLPTNVRVAVVSATRDQIVPPSLQQELAKALQEHKNPCELIETEGPHGAPPAHVYVQAMRFVLSKK